MAEQKRGNDRPIEIGDSHLDAAAGGYTDGRMIADDPESAKAAGTTSTTGSTRTTTRSGIILDFDD